MFGIIKKIFQFSGTKRNVLTKAIIVSFIGAIFTAFQFGALLYTTEAVLNRHISMNLLVKQQYFFWLCCSKTFFVFIIFFKL